MWTFVCKTFSMSARLGTLNCAGKEYNTAFQGQVNSDFSRRGTISIKKLPDQSYMVKCLKF